MLTQDRSSRVALDATECLLSMADYDGLQAVIGDRLPHLIPLLIRNMRYTDEDLENLEVSMPVV